MKAEIDEINEQLTIRTDYESDAYMKLIERVSDLSENTIEEVNYEAEVEKILTGLGLNVKILRVKLRIFGGWRMRIELAKILLQKSRFDFAR
jgi:ATP-binding cassette subfamily F protein 3